jgi:hypothetical protein
MARYKHIDTSPRFIAVDLERQLLPGSFEHALDHLIEHELDLSGFDARYHNDRAGASAYGFRPNTPFALSRAKSRTTRTPTIRMSVKDTRPPTFAVSCSRRSAA